MTADESLLTPEELQQTDIELEAIKSETEDLRFGPTHYDLLAYPADFTLEVLTQKFSVEEIVIPEMQRGFVWKQTQASRLIESFLLGLPVPPIYLYSEKTSAQLLVVDGQQRLRSIAYYFSETFGEEKKGQKTVFRLTLDENSEYNGKAFSDLTEEEVRRLKNSVLRAFIMKQVSPEDDTSIFHVFERLNTGGTLLTPQEVRNCIYDGPFNELLKKKLNLHESWRAIVGRKDPDKRLKDVELILRFLALFKNGAAYEKPMKDFLSDFMSSYRKGDANKEFDAIFVKVSDNVYRALGEKPFHIRAGLNAAVFDGLFVAFARHPEQIPRDVKERFETLKAKEAFIDLIGSGTTDVDTIRERLRLADECLFS